MPTNSSFSIEFPADKDYVPIMQDFLKNFLRNFDFSKEFSEYVFSESYVWFNSVVPEEKFLHIFPTIFLNVEISENKFSAKIRTSDNKELKISLDPRNLEALK